MDEFVMRLLVRSKTGPLLTRDLQHLCCLNLSLVNMLLALQMAEARQNRKVINVHTPFPSFWDLVLREVLIKEERCNTPSWLGVTSEGVSGGGMRHK